MNDQPKSMSEMFGPPVYSYSRKQALADGVQVDVSSVATEAGFRFPCYMTRTVWSAYVEVPPGVQGQEEQGRLWDIVFMLGYVLLRLKKHGARMTFQVMVRNDNRRPKLVTLCAVCGARDIDDPSPAITIMLPDED